MMDEFTEKPQSPRLRVFLCLHFIVTIGGPFTQNYSNGCGLGPPSTTYDVLCSHTRDRCGWRVDFTSTIVSHVSILYRVGMEIDDGFWC